MYEYHPIILGDMSVFGYFVMFEKSILFFFTFISLSSILISMYLSVNVELPI